MVISGDGLNFLSAWGAGASLPGCGVSPQNFFFFFFAPPQAAREEKRECGDTPHPGRRARRPPAPPALGVRNQPIKPAWRLNTFEQGEAENLIIFDCYEGQESANLLIFEWQQSLW
ncbi:hypothetical protein KDH_21580 [Dictyobacter sp. S3.2.2.5]|uniref:Uncharacterized protein n=1 Tax=Dictyobacter halimunensis TaxID=3026934 RepID=A0ABQ6FM26_9CHLR|nr:hypothetical protein KDH_21580 [Dictyobacter sp. S3.2.2.5]